MRTPGTAFHCFLTLAIGVSSAEQCSSLEELMASADRALYRAKKEGRARVCKA